MSVPIARTGQSTDLHDHVHESGLALFLPRKAVDGIDILLEHRSIPLALHFRKADVDIDLLLCKSISVRSYSCKMSTYSVADSSRRPP